MENAEKEKKGPLWTPDRQIRDDEVQSACWKQ